MGELKEYDIQGCIQKFQTNVFIETGTGKGNGIKYALKFPFTELHTIEMLPELYKENVSKIKDDRLTHHLGKSINCLSTILTELGENDRIVFWLDAHFPGLDYSVKDYSFSEKDDVAINLPLEEELRLIKKLRTNAKDVFIIDDLRIYEDGRYTKDNMPEKYKKIRDNYNVQGINFIFDLFGHSHNIKKSYKQQGFVFAEPKEEL